ncbi:ASCH domain-containing protein [Pseudarthrobacter cellobiosi]|uniref:ASCH domain-containing protein n=1 Tax=Pseudarthrobacter cellobiosi TaxID=2953654 RepID=UPI00208EA4A6|nr:ASCH domain-containing protein [Pseudarthrobacter sp. HLT1-5]MCO4257368.1 ASCH domain-containing protein [Pseudarthrobacter sp. HLT1-5]
MKALTVKQPWARAIIFDGKDVENRSKPTKYRGQLHIHAGLAWDKAAVAFIARITGRAYMATLHGSVIGTVDVVGCHHADDCWTGSIDKSDNVHEEHCSSWGMEGHYHWELANPQPVEPFAAKGKLGIWNLEAPS